MKQFLKLTVLNGLLLSVFTAGTLSGATLIIKDDFTAPNNLTGFNLNEGANSGINPPDFTRLEGIAKNDLRYSNLVVRSAYSITSNRLRLNTGAQVGRFTLGTSTGLFDFGPHLGIDTATPENPSVYDVTISMDNNAETARLSFGLATTASDVTAWDFGFQIVKSGTVYSIYQRMDTASTGLSSDLNTEILGIPSINAGTEVDFLMRVTDAGAETSTFSSRVQLSVDGGANWIYDSAEDPLLVETGWRLDGAARYLIGDIPANNGAFVTYDNLAVILNPLAEVIPAVLSTPTGTPGNLTLNFEGTPGATYLIQRVSSLPGTWQTIGTATTDGSTGVGSYTDSADHGSQNSFYRLLAL